MSAGAVLKRSAASPRLLQHTGKAVVFEDLTQRIDATDPDVDADSMLVLKQGGPVGVPGMPEYGNLSIPGRQLDLLIDDKEMRWRKTA